RTETARIGRRALWLEQHRAEGSAHAYRQGHHPAACSGRTGKQPEAPGVDESRQSCRTRQHVAVPELRGCPCAVAPCAGCVGSLGRLVRRWQHWLQLGQNGDGDLRRALTYAGGRWGVLLSWRNPFAIG